MPPSTPNDERRRETRYTVAKSNAIRVTIRRMVEDREETVRATLIDLSQGGAKLLVRASLQFSEAVELKLTIPNLGLNINADSQICWIRPSSDNQWLIGCSFTPKISEEILSQLASAGIVDRRSHPRHPVEMLATACWEAEKEPFPVVLRDYSANGFCMSSIRPGEVGQGVAIDLNTLGESDRDITGTVRWQIEWKGEYLIGCKMNDVEDFERLCEMGGVSADGDRTLWSTVTKRVPDEYRAYVFPAAVWIAVFGTSVVLGMSVPLFWHLTPDNAAALSLAERRAMAQERLVSAPGVSTPLPPGQPGAEQRVAQGSPTPSVELLLAPASSENQAVDAGGPIPENKALPQPTENRAAEADAPAQETSFLLQPTENRAAEADAPAQETSPPPPAQPTPDTQRPATADPSTTVATPELENEPDREEGLSFQAPGTDDDFAPGTARAPAEDLSMPPRVADPNGSDATPSPRELEEASQQVQAFIRSIVGNGSGDHVAEDRTDSASTVPSSAQDEPPSPPSGMSHGPNSAEEPIPHLQPNMLPGGKRELGAPVQGNAGRTNRLPTAPPRPQANSKIAAQRAREAWQQGGQLYRASQFPEASEALRDAVRYDPLNALYRYVLAMSLYQMRQFDEAEQMLKRAIQLELSRPIAARGSLLSRYQGQPRLWIEKHRSAARQYLPQ